MPRPFEVYTLARDQLDMALERFPEDAKIVHRAYMRVAFKAAIRYEVRWNPL